MSNSSREGCISEVTLAISKARGTTAGAHRVLDSPNDSDGSSGHSQSFTVQSYDYPDNGSPNNNSVCIPTVLTSEDLRIPIVGYEVMEERARFTVTFYYFFSIILFIYFIY